MVKNIGWRMGVAMAGLAGIATLALAQADYTVRSGDTLDSISKKHEVSPGAITTLNDLANPDRITPGMVLKIPESATAPKRYDVKSGDTLGSIAAAHKVSVAALSELNKIEDPKKLRAGQIVMIPSSDGEAGAVAVAVDRHPLPGNMKTLLDAMPVTRGKWKYIVVHHSASKKGTLQGMDMYHRQKRKMENGLAYHFVIGNGFGMPDGKIEIGNRWKRQIKGGHLASAQLNEVAIGICLVGNFEVDRPSTAQMQSLFALISYLNRRCGMSKSAVRTHKQINTKPTACPGKLFPAGKLMDNL
jgi:LysM repeat protein